jgi:thioredoxin 1
VLYIKPEQAVNFLHFPASQFLVRIAPEIKTPSSLPAIPPTLNKRDFTMSEHINYVSDATFDATVLQAPLPVLVDYWAEWCGPCRMIAPILDEISKEYAGRLTVAKLNVDENQQTPAKYGIRGIPTLMLFKNGNIEATKVGAVSKSQLTAFIDSHI